MFGPYGAKPWWSRTRYASVASLESDDMEKPLHEHELSSTQQRPQPRTEQLKNISLIFLMMLVTILSLSHVQLPRRRHSAVPNTETSNIPGSSERQLIPYVPITQYTAKTLDQVATVNARWESFRPAFGIVALDDSYTESHNLLRADRLKGDNSKGVYVIEGYHMLHCLILLRRTMNQLIYHEELSAPLGHAMHCFDALRQAVICQADDNLMYVRHGLTDGEGQPRTCRSWEGLREFAAKNSACYDDGKAGVKYENQTGCAERIAFGDGMDLISHPA